MRALSSKLTTVRSLRVGALPLVSMLVLGGCAVGPHYTPPDTKSLVATAYTTSAPALASGDAADRWWSALGDQTLDRLVERALSDNPDLASAEARVRQARALAGVAGADLYPAANLGGRVSRDRLSLNGENLALIPITPKTVEFTDYKVGLDASWEIDLAGRTRREVEAAVARFGSSAETRNDARSVVAAEVADSYVNYRANSERLSLARRTLAGLDETLRLVGLQEQAGVASEQDRRRAESERLAAASSVAPLEAAVQTDLYQLAALTGQNYAAVAAELAESRPIPAVPDAVPVGMPSDLLRRRPDVRRAERELAGATADVGGAVAAQFPRLSLVGDLGWDSVRTGNLTNAASRYWNFGPQLTLPLFAGGRLRYQVKAAEAAREAALASYRGTVLKAFADAESSIVRFAAERGRAAILAVAAATLDASLELERRRFAAGEVAAIDVLAAQRTADQAADQRAASAGELARNFIALGKALGGGWQP